MNREEFVKEKIVEWLRHKKFRIAKVTCHRKGIDISAYHYNGQGYYIECKGETKGENSSLDTNTAIGQIILRMNETRTWKKYFIGVPNTKHFKRQIDKYKMVSKSIRKALKITFLLVDSIGNIEICKTY